MLKGPVTCLCLMLVLSLGANAWTDSQLQVSPVDGSADQRPADQDTGANTEVVSSAKPTSILQTLELPTDFEQTAALYALLARSGVDDLKRFVLEAQTIPNSGDRNTGLRVIYSRFADIDPQQAISHLLDAGLSNTDTILSSIFFNWSLQDLDAAIGECQALADRRNQQIAVRAILLANQDQPVAELERIGQRLGPEAVAMVTDGLMRRELAQLAETNPQAAAQQAMQFPDHDRRYSLMQLVGRKWADDDPLAALSYIKNLHPGSEQSSFDRIVLGAIAETHPQQALGLINGDRLNHQDRQLLVMNMMDGAGQIDPHKALEMANSLVRASDREQAIGNLLGSVNYYDPDTALEMLQSLSDVSVILRSGGEVIRDFARAQPAAALKWAAELFDEEPAILNSVIVTIGETNPDRAFELLSQQPASPVKSRTLQSVLSVLARNSPSRAAGHLDVIPKGPGYQQLAASIATSWLERDPDSALAWVFTLDRQVQSRVLIDVRYSVVNVDIEYAQSLLPVLPSAHVRQTWIATIVSQLSSTEGVTVAMEWLSDYKADPHYTDWVNELLAGTAGRGSAEQAIRLADDIAGEAEYNQAVQAIVRNWAMQDAEGAAEWVLNESKASDRSSLIQAVVNPWSDYDIRSAHHWVMNFKVSEERDSGLATLLKKPYVEPGMADEILRQMISSELKFDALKAYVGSMARYDARSARLFVSHQSLMSGDADMLMKIIEDAEMGAN